MTKRQLIDEIVTINHSAHPGFLARFDDGELNAYLQHLKTTQDPRLTGDPHRYDHYFVGVPTVPTTSPSLAALKWPYEIGLTTEGESSSQEDPDEPPEMLDLNVSPDAFFKESYEADTS